MNKNVVRIQVETIKPGELVRGGMIQIYTEPTAYDTHFAWYPTQPRFTTMDDLESSIVGEPVKKMIRFEEGGYFMRFDALGPETDGWTKGDIDFLMEDTPARILFADDLPEFARMATTRIEQFGNHPLWAMLAVYNVDVPEHKVEFNAFLELEEAILPEPI